MRTQRYIKRNSRIAAVAMVLSLLVSGVSPVMAAKSPSASMMASQMEQRYNMNLGSIQNMAQEFNVSSSKKTAPEVSLFFSPSDPKVGAKLTARALPMYFSRAQESMYYTWYLKRKDCGVSDCDYNSDGKYNSKDWRIEAARIIAQNGYENDKTSYASDSDSDGYQARFGGDNKVDKADYCYVYDPGSGALYELASGGAGSTSTSFSCPAGTSPVCMQGENSLNSSPSSLSGGDGVITAFTETAANCSVGGCSVIGTPSCSGSSVSCSDGTPCCVADAAGATSCTQPLLSCSSTLATSSNPVGNGCQHVFAQPTSGTTGDGSFGRTEEQFWETDPNDPSTANNSKKDEANVAGLGVTEFTWNYLSGDQLGVAIEGTAMMPTKHDNASYMTMWPFPKNRCYPAAVGAGTGSYVQKVKGYNVTFPTTNLDLNDCVEKNLVDPTEGGQATNLTVQVAAAPENPVNDETTDKNGDTVTANAIVDNASQGQEDVLYEWAVEMDTSPRFASPTDITSDLSSRGLIGNTKGTGLDSLSIKLDLPATVLGAISGGIGYLRIKVKVEESFEGGGSRRGKSDIIMKFSSTGKRISAYSVKPVVVSSKTQVALDNVICNSSALERTACRVIKNEIIGLRIDPSGLDNFVWSVNGKPLVCTNEKMSPDCTDGSQNHVAFIPIAGNVGDVYQVAVTANDIASGKTVTLSRAFHIVDPFIKIVSMDTNTVWSKLLGFYKDVLGTAAANCPNGLCPDYSDSAMQAFSESTAKLKAEYVPSFVGSNPGLLKEWQVDGTVVAETGVDEIMFPMDKLTGQVYAVSVNAVLTQSDQLRRALYEIWQISPLESTEVRFGGSVQIDMQEAILAQGEKGEYYALISKYVPETVLFSLRMLMTGALLLFAVGFLGALIPNRAARIEQE